ncbi:hypothetical protein T439DRAFT_326456 [Meredithblackwellia eburnea MCA 4105]
MSAFDRFRGSDLATFFRSLAYPAFDPGPSPSSSSANSANSNRGNPYAASFRSVYDWEQLRTTIQRGGGHLEFFDAGLWGQDGAQRVLIALERQPTSRSITLSQNNLADDGLRFLLVGMKRLRHRAIGGQLKELNLSTNGLTDVSLHLLALHLLTPSPHPPSITHLFLSNNRFTLADEDLARFLAIALSSPDSSLQCLTLTNNPLIGTLGVKRLLESLKLGPKTSLSQLHLSLCGLTPDAAGVIAEWLADPDMGGARLQAFCANGNFLSSPGMRRIARPIISGHCSGLLLLEIMANESGDDKLWSEELAKLESSELTEDLEGWEMRLERATERNKRVYKATRDAALRLLPQARVLFGGDAREREVDVASIREGVENMLSSTSSTNSHWATTAQQPIFPFLRLPIELRVHVLRCSLLLHPSKDAHLYPPVSHKLSSPPIPIPDASTISSPLTESQFLHVLAFASSPETLATEVKIAQAEASGKAPVTASLNGFENGAKRFGQESPKAGTAGDGRGWQEWALREMRCDRFARA